MAELEVQNGETVVSEVGATFSALKPHLYVQAPNANDAVLFYKAAFGAVETGRVTHSKRKADQELPHIVSAHLLLAGCTIVVADVSQDSTSEVPAGGTMALLLETENVDAAISKAVAAGAVAEGETVEDENGVVAKVKDPYGFSWVISSPIKKLEVVDVEAA